MDLFPETMSVQLVEEYYRNNRRPFFAYMDEHVIWIGPVTKQYMEGKENILHAFGKEQNTLRFHTAQMSSKCIAGGAASCEVFLRFTVYTHYPSGYIDVRKQRITLFWKKGRQKGGIAWRYAVIHISNGGDMDERDHIYPIHIDEFEAQKNNISLQDLARRQPKRLIVKAADYATHYIDENDILCICGGKGKYSDIHTCYGVVRARLLIDQIEKKLSDRFYRPHRSYLVNLLAIIKVARYRITLKNDAVIPIPEKKYKTVSDDIHRRMQTLQA